MLVCFTRALRARYREDVIRVLAYPRGGVVQYRYGLNFVEEDARKRLQAAKPGAETVALCFVHFEEHSQVAKVVPLRLGKLMSSEVVGSSIILTMEVGEFTVEAGDLYQELRSAHGDIVPHKEEPKPDSKVGGSFVFFASDKLFEQRQPDLLTGFESAVNALTAFPLFKQTEKEDNPCSLFFHVRGLRSLTTGVPKLLNWIDRIWSPPPSQQTAPFSVMSGARYELEVYHYYPEHGRPDETIRKEIQVSSPSELIEFVSDKRLVIDSEYDVKKLQFDVKRSSTSHQTVIDLCVLSGDLKTEHAKLNLQTKIRWNFILVKVQLIAITLGVSMPGVIALMSSGKSHNPWTFVAMLVSGAVVALAATFGIKRGL